MRSYLERYTQAELARNIFAIEDELTSLWLAGGMAGITDVRVQKDFRKRIEAASFGRNTVRFDANGQPSVLVKFSPDDKSKLAYLYADSTAGMQSSFIIDGKAKPWYRGKYQMGRVNGTNYPVCLRGLEPWYNITFDAAQAAIVAKGSGYCLPTQQMESFLALACGRNGFEPGGNTYYGAYYYAQDEKGVASGMYSGANYYHTKGGFSPLSWSHDGTPFGCFDIVGNTWKWTGALRTVNGEIQTFADNNGAGTLSTVAAHAVASASWKAIDVDGNLVTPEAATAAYADATVYATDTIVMHNGVRYKSLTNHTSEAATEPGVGASWETVWVRKGTLHYAWNGTKVLLTDHAEGLDETSRSVGFGALTSDITVPAIAYNLGLFPKYTTLKGTLYIRGGERVALRGGSFYSTSYAGVVSLTLYYGRGSSGNSFGSGLAYTGD